MRFLSKIGVDLYMLLLLASVGFGLLLSAQGMVADVLGHVTFWAVAFLFFLHGAKIDPRAIRNRLLN
ncbi:hypothetical protein [Roseovarius sp. A-2]|uniref:hypothetical protein n=1 Tax=Roseovarius sp. A-2 TaxID=1570360 RepID=UPI0020CB0704|nr:hypothetical protein [Roseovarius sp. A-2]